MDNQDTMRKGILAAKAGNSILARLHLQEAVETDPDSVDCWLWLAWVTESPASARLFLERVLQLDPHHEVAQTGLRWTESLCESCVPELTEVAVEGKTTITSPDNFVIDEHGNPNSVVSKKVNQQEPGGSPEAEAISASLAEETLEPEVFETTAQPDFETVEQDETTLCGEFSDEYCMQEAVVASVDHQLTSLFTSEKLLDELQTIDSDFEQADTAEDRVSAIESESDSHSQTNEAVEFEVAPKTSDELTEKTGCAESLEPSAEAKEGSTESPAESTTANHKQSDSGTVASDHPSPTDESALLEHENEQDPVDSSQSASAGDDRPLIVVCDDSPTVRKLVCMSLEPHGFSVMTADDGVEGSDLIRRVVPHLVLTDINMPEMDGYQLCKSVTKNPLTQDIPVIMLSGKDGLFDKLRGKLVGSTDHLSKPFSPRDLLRVVRSHLEASSAWSH
jgi:twitching motility two-component system response regulator PilG